MKLRDASSAAVNWSKSLPQTATKLAGGICHNIVWQSVESTLHGFDQFTGQQVYWFGKFGDSATVRALAQFEDGLLVFAADGYLYKVVLDSNVAPVAIAYVEDDVSWMRSYRGSVYVATVRGGVQRVPPADENVPPGPNGRITPGYGPGIIGDYPSIGDGFLLVPTQNRVDAIDAEHLTLLWSIPTAFTPQWKGTSFNGETFCFASGPSEACAISVPARKVAWRQNFASAISGRVACDAKFCFAPLGSGLLAVLSISDGNLVQQFELPGIAFGNVQDDGLFYGGSEDGFVCAVDAVTGAVAKMTATGLGLTTGVDNGVLYFHDNVSIQAVRLADLARQFYAEATLMQDFDFAGGPAEPTKLPLIHTEITVYDKDGSVQARQLVRVGATQPTTIESGGSSYAVGPNLFADIPTDANGRLRISLPAGDSDENGKFRDGLTSANLTLVTTFMDPGQSMLVRPASQLHDKLAKITAADLQNAKGYDKNPIVAEQYRKNDKAMGNIAKVVNASFTMIRESVDHKNQLRAARDNYLAPGCAADMICCCKTGDYHCPVVCRRNFAFDLGGDTSFGYLDQHQTETWLQANPVSNRVPRGFSDLWESIKNGAAKIGKVLVYAAEEATHVVKTVVNAVIDGVEATVEFVLDTIEKAAELVQGLFNTIVGAARKVLEALSFAFSWSHIIELKETIKSKVESTWDALLNSQSGKPSVLDQAQAAAISSLANFRAHANEAFDQLKGKLGATSASAQQKQVSDGKSPSAGGSTGNWLQAKMEQNLLSEAAMQRMASRQSAAAVPAISLPDFVLPEAAVTEMDNLLTELSRVATADVKETLDRIRRNLTPDAGFDFFAASVATIVDVVRGASNIALDAAQAGIAGLVRVFKTIAAAIRDVCKKPVKIPFISDLYHYVTGSDLTLLDFGALLIAVPASVIIAAETLRNPPAARSLRDLADLSGKVLGTIAGVAQIVWAVTSASMNLLNAAVGGSISGWLRNFIRVVYVVLTLAIGFAARLLLCASTILSFVTSPSRLSAGLALWLLPTLSLVFDLGGMCLKTGKWTDTARPYVLAAGATCGLIGTLVLLICVKERVYAFEDTHDALFLTSNLCGFFALGARLGILIPSDYQLVFVAVVSVLQVTAGALKIASSFVSSPMALRHAG